MLSSKVDCRLLYRAPRKLGSYTCKNSVAERVIDTGQNSMAKLI
jgi:hypothetical protein